MERRRHHGAASFLAESSGADFLDGRGPAGSGGGREDGLANARPGETARRSRLTVKSRGCEARKPVAPSATAREEARERSPTPSAFFRQGGFQP